MFGQRLDSYLTLPSDFGVYHCECQSDLLLLLQGTVGEQKIGVVGNTIQVLLQFSSGVSLPKILIGPGSTKLLENRKGAVFFETQLVPASYNQ